MSRKKIDIQSMSVSNLLKYVDEGHFAIPKLQREFVWDGPKAAKLFDSIYAHMPIGVVMVWETPKSQRLYLRQKYNVLPPFNPRNGTVWFLIDGQQRLSVLYLVREGSTIPNAKGGEIHFSRVVLSLEKEQDGQQIRYRKSLPGRYEPLPELLHPNWNTRLSHLTKRQKDRAKTARERILRYPMQLMFVQAKIGEIRETFLRINTQGMKITTADAIFTKAEGFELRDILHEVHQHIDEGFGLVPEMPVLFALAAVRGGKEARGRALQQVINRLEREARSDRRLRKALARDWHRLVVCFGKAVDYLRQNYAVLSREFLYSDYMVAMLALFFYWNGRGPSTMQKEQIRRWYWATAVGSRYSGRNFLRCVPEDVKFFERLSRIRRARFTYTPQVERSDVRKALFASRTGITSAFYCLLLRRHPVSIIDDGLNDIPLDRYSTRANRKDRHHIFPKAILGRVEIPPNQINSIGNICLLTAEENQTIGSKRPRSYLGDVRSNGKYFKRKMERHLIPVESDGGVWLSDIRRGFNRFIRERTNMICLALEEEAGTKLFRKDL